MRWASASAVGSDLPALLDRVVGEIVRGLAGRPAHAVFVFLGPDHASRSALVRDRVRDACPGASLVGGTAMGVVGGGREHESAAALSVAAAHLPGVDVRALHVTQERLPSQDAPPAAWQAMFGVMPAARPSFVWIADPFSIRPDALVAGLDFAYPGHVTVGGLASGASGPGEQVLFCDERLVRTGAVGLALSGDVVVVPAVAQGCRPFGPVMRVSACQDNLLLALDGEPAMDAVSRVLREAAERDRSLARVSALFLGIDADPFAAPDDEGPWLVRNFLGRERDGAGLFVGEMLRQGRRVRLHVRDRVTSAEDLDRTLRRCADRAGTACAGALLFSCLGRGMGLYGVPDHDTRAFQTRFPDVALGGFFCSGEIGPVGGTTYLHGFTSSFGLFLPREAADGDGGPAPR